MSVVRSRTVRRWSVVAGGAAVLLGLPTLVPAARAALTGPAGPPPPVSVLVRGALRSDTVAYSGLARSRGGTSLPDLPRLADVTAILGGTTRLRVWHAAPTRWRVDTIGLTGESDVYSGDGGLVTWDYEATRLTRVIGTPRVRFPRADDLLPPQAAVRVLRGLGPRDRIDLLPGTRWVAGRPATGLRVVPGDPHGTVAAVDILLDRRTRLPLAVTVRGPGGEVALDSAFESVTFGPPPATVLTPPDPRSADHDVVLDTDLAQQVDRFARFPLPDDLAGRPRTDPLVPGSAGGGTATYGTGLARFVVLPLRGRLGGQVAGAAAHRGALPLTVVGGTAYLLRSGVLTVAVAQDVDADRTFLLSGLVDADTLQAAAQDLLAVRGR